MVSGDSSQTTLLRIAAFLVDAVTMAIVLILPASLISYALAWIGGSVKGIQIVWWVALATLILSILIRDGIRGRSVGKQLLGLTLTTRSGGRCGYLRSVIRNIPLIVPLWNVIEVGFVLAGKARTGDRIAGTHVIEE
ncbi:MAG TPA: RDD family protein [Thermoanaerobaculia bacterium]|nr:RDD family protein [Thermoanaerobaculia bacterium]